MVVLKLIFTGFLALIALGTNAATDWKLARDRDGIQVYTRKIDGIDFNQYRGKTSVNSSLSAIISAFNDHEAAVHFSDKCDRMELVETISPVENYTYLYSKAPWPIKDRDAVVHNRIEQDPDTHQVTILQIGAPKKRPEHEKVIRIQRIEGIWTLTPLEKGKTELIYESLSDPGGGLPAWLVNAVSVSIPYSALYGIRETAQSEPHKNASFEFISEFSIKKGAPEDAF